MNNSTTLDKTTSTIISFILFVLVLRTSLYTYGAPVFHTFLSILRFISWGLFLILHLRFPLRLDKIGFWMLAYGALIGYSTITHNSDVPFTVVSIGFDVLMLWGIMKLYLPEYGELILRSIIVSMSICIYTNLLLVLIFPSGLWEQTGSSSYYLLGGNYNQMGRTIIPAITIMGFYRMLYNRKSKALLALIIASVITLVIVGSKTSLVGISLLIAFYLIKSYRTRKRLIILFIIAYFLFQAFAVFGVYDLSKNQYIVYFVEQVLHKDLTFTNRTQVWFDCFKLIIQSPIVGYGIQSDDWYKALLDVTSAHNLVLGKLLCGGIIGLLLFIMIIISAVKKHIQHPSPASQFLFFGLCTFLFMMIMEVYPFTCIALLLLLLYYSEQFEINSKTENQTEAV